MGNIHQSITAIWFGFFFFFFCRLAGSLSRRSSTTTPRTTILGSWSRSPSVTRYLFTIYLCHILCYSVQEIKAKSTGFFFCSFKFYFYGNIFMGPIPCRHLTLEKALLSLLDFRTSPWTWLNFCMREGKIVIFPSMVKLWLWLSLGHG